MSGITSRHGSANHQRRGQLFASNHKQIHEEAMVRRREAGRMRDEFWKSTSHYFDRLHQQNEKFEHWSSPEMAEKRYRRLLLIFLGQLYLK
jgi:hypothetical protein